MTAPFDMAVDMGLIFTYVSILTAIHAGLALLQARLWKSERIWESKKIFFLSLIYFPIGFLGFRAWQIYQLKKSRLELIVFSLLLSLFFFLFWKFGFHNESTDRWMTWRFSFGIENRECLTASWPFSTSIWLISYLCNLLVFHHFAWPVFELSFWGIKRSR